MNEFVSFNDFKLWFRENLSNALEYEYSHENIEFIAEVMDDLEVDNDEFSLILCGGRFFIKNLEKLQYKKIGSFGCEIYLEERVCLGKIYTNIYDGYRN